MAIKSDYVPVIRRFNTCPKCKSNNITLVFTGAAVSPRCVACSFKPTWFAAGLPASEFGTINAETWEKVGEEKKEESAPGSITQKIEVIKTPEEGLKEIEKVLLAEPVLSTIEEGFRLLGYSVVKDDVIQGVFSGTIKNYTEENTGYNKWICPKCGSTHVHIISVIPGNRHTLGCGLCFHTEEEEETSLWSLMWELKRAKEQYTVEATKEKAISDEEQAYYDRFERWSE